MQLYCSRYLNTAHRFYQRRMALCNANSPFSQLVKMFSKIALEGDRVVLCTPDLCTTGKHTCWRRFSDRTTVGRSPGGPIRIAGAHRTKQKPCRKN